MRVAGAAVERASGQRVIAESIGRRAAAAMRDGNARRASLRRRIHNCFTLNTFRDVYVRVREGTARDGQRVDAVREAEVRLRDELHVGEQRDERGEVVK